MSWYGKITAISSTGSNLNLTVSFFEQSEPENSFPRELSLPLPNTEADIVRAIQDEGKQVRSFVLNVSKQSAVGKVVPIPD